MQRHSLRWQFVISYALLIVVAMGGISLFLFNFIKTTYINNITENLFVNSRVVTAEILDSTDLAAPFDSEKTIVRELADLLEMRVTLISPNGAVIAESSLEPDNLENHLNRPEVKAALQGTPTSATRFSKTLNQEMLYAANPIEKGGAVVGVVRLAVPLTKINEGLTTVSGTIFGGTAVATIAAVLLAGFLTGYTTHPLRELTESVKNFSHGSPAEIKETNRKDEIGTLTRAFSSMATQINAQFDELENERTRLAAVLAYMTDAVLIVDEDGQVQLVNPAAQRLFETTERNALNHSLVEVVRHHQLVELWRKCQESGEQQITTLETTPSRLFLQGIATPLRQDLPGNTLLVIQDLTRVRRLEVVRRDFVSNVSHELRTPLASLKALTETLQEGALEDPPAARRFLLRMENEIDNLTQMVNELLELSKIESGRVPLERKSISPLSLVNPAVERMALQAERSGIEMRVEIAPDLPPVYADPKRMEQVLINLLHNAIKFTPPGGEINVLAYLDVRSVVFCVRDSGVGISPQDLPRIFERFYKADRSRSGGGTGLGLSIVRHLVESHGGRIWAESKPNEGAAFYFSLPVA